MRKSIDRTKTRAALQNAFVLTDDEANAIIRIVMAHVAPPPTLTVSKDDAKALIDRMEEIAGRGKPRFQVVQPEVDSPLRTTLWDKTAPMADGAEPMTAAEEALTYLLVEHCGVPDDVSYTPSQATQIIIDRLHEGKQPTPLDAHTLADALDCFWNASLNECHRNQSGTGTHETLSAIATGFAAIANRLRETP